MASPADYDEAGRSQVVSSDEIAKMYQQLTVIKTTAAKKIREKEDQINLLESENQRLKASISRNLSMDRSHNDSADLSMSDAQDQNRLRERLDRADNEKQGLLVKLLGAKESCSRLEAELGEATRHQHELMSRVSELEGNLARRGPSNDDSRIQEEKLRVRMKMLEDERDDRNRRLQRIMQRLQGARGEMANVDNQIAQSRAQQRGPDAEFGLLVQRMQLADQTMRDVMMVAGDGAGVDRSFDQSSILQSAPLRSSPAVASPYRPGAAEISTSSPAAGANMSWRSKAENLTTELQVLQRELRKHLSELRGGDEPRAPVAGGEHPQDPLVVVVTKKAREDQAREEERQREDRRRQKEEERAQLEREQRERDRAAEQTALQLKIKQAEFEAMAAVNASPAKSAPGNYGEPSFQSLRDREPFLTLIGDLTEGELLTVRPAARLGDPARFEVNWSRYASRSGRGQLIPHAQSLSYALTQADVGNYLEVSVLPNAASHAPPIKFMTETKVESALPTLLEPRIIGHPINTTQFVFEGRYIGGEPHPKGHQYQWFKSTNGHEWTLLEYAKEKQYQATSDDIASYLRCEVVPIRTDGQIGSLVGVNTEQIRLDPEIQQLVNTYWANEEVVFDVSVRSSANASDDQPGKLALHNNRLELYVRNRKAHEVKYTTDIKVLLHPSEVKVLKLRLGYKPNGDSNDVILATASSRLRDIISLSLFGFAQIQDNKLKSGKSWGRASTQPQKSVPSGKSTSVHTSIKEGERNEPEEVEAIYADGEAAPAKRESRHRGDMSEAEYKQFKKDKLAAKKATMTPEEFDRWVKERKDRKKSGMPDTEKDDLEESAKPEPVTQNSALPLSDKDDKDDERAKRLAAKKAENKASMTPEQYAAWKEDRKARHHAKSTMTPEQYEAWKVDYEAKQARAAAPAPAPTPAAAVAERSTPAASSPVKGSGSSAALNSTATAPVPTAEPAFEEGSRKHRHRRKEDGAVPEGEDAGKGKGKHKHRSRHTDKGAVDAEDAAAAAPAPAPRANGMTATASTPAAPVAATPAAASTVAPYTLPPKLPSTGDKKKDQEARKAQIKAVLTPEQWAHYKEEHKARRDAKKSLGGDSTKYESWKEEHNSNKSDNSAGASRHEARKAGMSPEEYKAYKEAKLAKKKATMSPEEFAAWKAAHRSRKSNSRKSQDASHKEPESAPAAVAATPAASSAPAAASSAAPAAGADTGKGKHKHRHRSEKSQKDAEDGAPAESGKHKHRHRSQKGTEDAAAAPAATTSAPAPAATSSAAPAAVAAAAAAPAEAESGKHKHRHRSAKGESQKEDGAAADGKHKHKHRHRSEKEEAVAAPAPAASSAPATAAPAATSAAPADASSGKHKHKHRSEKTESAKEEGSSRRHKSKGKEKEAEVPTLASTAPVRAVTAPAEVPTLAATSAGESKMDRDMFKEYLTPEEWTRFKDVQKRRKDAKATMSADEYNVWKDTNAADLALANVAEKRRAAKMGGGSVDVATTAKSDNLSVAPKSELPVSTKGEEDADDKVDKEELKRVLGPEKYNQLKEEKRLQKEMKGKLSPEEYKRWKADHPTSINVREVLAKAQGGDAAPAPAAPAPAESSGKHKHRSKADMTPEEYEAAKRRHAEKKAQRGQ